VVLVLTIGLGRLRGRAQSNETTIDEADSMKNSQLAILCCAVLGGSLIVAGTNIWLVRSLRPADIVPASTAAKSGKRPVIAMMPKAKGDPYFISCKAGAEEAAKELGVDLIWDGPTGLDAAKQNEVVEGWITRGVDAIAVSVENSAGLTVLRKA
jgi:rhamnose transport system permease protein